MKMRSKYLLALPVFGLDPLADPGRELHVGLHDRDALGVLCAELRVDEEGDDVVLCRLLEGLDRRALEADVGLGEPGGDDVTDELRERQLPDEQVCGLLVLLDLLDRDHALLLAAGLLDPARRGRRLAGGLARDRLARGLRRAGRLACRVLGACHFVPRPFCPKKIDPKSAPFHV